MEKKLTGTISLTCLALLLVAGCGKREQEQQTQQQAQTQTQAPAQSSQAAQPTVSTSSAPQEVPTREQLTEAAAKTQESLAQVDQGKVVEAVDFRELKELFPQSLAGMERTDASGERTKMGGVDISNAEALYESAGDSTKQISVVIMDMGNVAGPFRMGLAAWASTEFDHETDSGYERTTAYKGHKAVEELNRESQKAVFRVFVADRFMVEVEGSNVPMETVKKAMDGLDLAKLASLATGK